jgi:hypothetical protein
MGKVLVQISGDKLDIEDLQLELKNFRWKIIEEQNNYFLTSDILDSCDDNTEIISKANDFLDIINGAAKIIHEDHIKVTTNSIRRINENGNGFIHHVMISETARARSRCSAIVISKENNQEELKTTVIEDWLLKADVHKSVKNALHFFNENETTWINLYKVYDIIEEDLGGEKALLRFFQDGIKDFKYIANNYLAIGDHARHANQKHPAPKRILTLNEAYSIIKNLFEKWVLTKQ